MYTNLNIWPYRAVPTVIKLQIFDPLNKKISVEGCELHYFGSVQAPVAGCYKFDNKTLELPE
jgi:hypothetical protein